MASRFSYPPLRQSAPHILPSMLLCDFGNLHREVVRLEEAGVQALHLDVMDGHFVPNLTYGMPIVAALRKLTEMPLDVHLMISHPSQYVSQFIDAGADVVTIHVEAVEDAGAVLDSIHRGGASAGLALNPVTPLSAVEPHLDQCDVVLVMGVNAGFGGQQFNPVALDKLNTLRAIVKPGTWLEIDGGVNSETIAACVDAGADLLVAGSAIFRESDYSAAIARLRSQLSSGSPGTRPVETEPR